MDKVKHIKVLGIANPDLLGDPSHIENTMIKLIDLVGMRILGKPAVFDVPLEINKLNSEQFEDEGGVTTQIVGFSTLTTSHVAIHTWPLRKEFHLDLYSCRFFSKEKAIGFLTDLLQIERAQISDLTEYCEWQD